ncbi:H-NS family nucleoid-associated regulatory protein [Pseudorhodoferax sp.]|uniref:H-NS histone family protein n=1 Tax=Pseudorhodoferax sp. TaxID=1993553 RepID=UPI0039E6BEE5
MKTRRAAAKFTTTDPTVTLKEIDQEIAKLQEQAAAIVAAEKASVIVRMKEAIAYYGITVADLGLGKAAEPKPKSTKAKEPAAAAPPAKKPRAGAGRIRFKDDAGNTWSGFGPKPRWFTEALASGKTVEDLKA